MTNTRITKYQAARIADAMMAVKAYPEKRKREDEIYADIEQRLMNYVPQAVKDFAVQYPKYIQRSNYLYVQNQNGLRTAVSTRNPVINLPCSEEGYVKISNEDFETFDKHREELNEMNANLRTLGEAIIEKLKGRGAKGVCETWPEACPYVKAEMGENEPQLPAVMNAELNMALGIPVE